MSQPVFILGGYQTDFARNWAKEGGGIFPGLTESVEGALEDARITPNEIDRFEVGNFVAELFTGQGHLGGMVASIHPDLAGKPGSRHEAACASGSMAMLAAMSSISAGWSDVVLVSGVEQMRNVDSITAAEHLGAALWVGEEALGAEFPWPHQFARIADAYEDRYGLDHSHLEAISRKNFTNARSNPNAQARDWEFGPSAFGEDDDHNPVIDGHLRKQDCGRITDGSVSVILAGSSFAAEFSARHGRPLEELPRIAGWGQRTAQMLLDRKLEESADGGLMFPHMARAAADARQRAGIGDLGGIDVVETHDCFSISEYVAYDHLGLSAPGDAWKVVESGATEVSGTIPFNPSGGLIGAGHPVGATGVRMVLDAARQVTGSAGDYQVEGAKAAQTLNVGGSITTVASFVVTAG